MAGTRYQTVAVNNSFNLRDESNKDSKVGILEQLVNAVSAFNSRFETTFISSDAIIYAIVIISLLVYVILNRF